ncbi:hypothetical protein ACFCV3_10110 [Kribbella sp. NPDC056345]|uniref:hypothetical protein n=1 Tax=Kribbella sp. NPDC056345 TaxID=3345789 RepID=UPI0035DEC10A
MKGIHRQLATAAAVLAALTIGLIGTPAGAAPPAAKPDSAAKPAAVDNDDVYTVERLANGQTRIGLHQHAGNAEALRRDLRAAGKNVLSAGQAPPGGSMSPLACVSYGTAVQWCDHAWGYGGFNDPQVYFLDHTPAGFPVTAAVADWYQSPGIDAYYRWHTAGCPGGGRHCVHVRTYSPGPNEFGVTYWSPNAPNGPVDVYLANHMAGTNQARKSTCHELGHALGLGHNSSTNSCMVQGRIGAGWSLRPSSQDFEVLNRVYPRPGT